jgi:hypothetical protein
MNFIDWITTGVGALLGSGVTMWATRKQENRSDFVELVDKWKAFSEEIKAREHKCEEELARVKTELQQMHIDVIELKKKVA